MSIRIIDKDGNAMTVAGLGGAGDMPAAVYDPQGRKTDIFDELDKKIAADEDGTVTLVNDDINPQLILSKGDGVLDVGFSGGIGAIEPEDGLFISVGGEEVVFIGERYNRFTNELFVPDATDVRSAVNLAQMNEAIQAAVSDSWEEEY